jgi:CheY-like chemotaxis protein
MVAAANPLAADVLRHVEQETTILVVDDEPDDRRLIAAELADYGYATVFACDETSARTALDTFTPDAILLDFYLPYTNGLTLLKILRCMPRLRQVPIVLLSAYDPLPFLIDAHQAGAAAVLTKSYTARTLGPALRRLLSGEPGARDGGLSW